VTEKSLSRFFKRAVFAWA